MVLALQITLIITSLLVVLLVLLHRAKGGGLSTLFGGGVQSSLSGSTVVEKNLDRLTYFVTAIWVVSIVGVALQIKYSSPPPDTNCPLGLQPTGLTPILGAWQVGELKTHRCGAAHEGGPRGHRTDARRHPVAGHHPRRDRPRAEQRGRLRPRRTRKGGIVPGAALRDRPLRAGLHSTASTFTRPSPSSAHSPISLCWPTSPRTSTENVGV